MLTFEEIEDCFPDGMCSDDKSGKAIVSAQWLHDFANAIAAKEREACAKVAEDWHERSRGQHNYGLILAREICERSNAAVSGRGDGR